MQKIKQNATISQKAKAMLFVAICILGACVNANAKDYAVLKDSYIGFEVKKFGLMNVKGNFKEFSGELSISENGEITALQGEVASASVFSDSTKRDKHLLESDFLDADAFPTMRLQMLNYTQQSREPQGIKGKLNARLEIRGQSKEVEFHTVLTQEDSTKLELSGTINIKDFGIDGSMMNANTVRIILQTNWQEK